ncbi:MAG: T9SS type A sorting domain-containing protein [Bacteroidota bacterium]
MKKIYSLLTILLLNLSVAHAQCIIDANAQTFPGVNPLAEQLPCVISGTPYDQTLQGQIQQSDDISILILSLHVEVDSVSIDSIAGLPNGLTWSKNPNVLLGGGNGCLQLTGTTNDPAGRYDLTAFGTAWLTVTSPINFPRAITGNLNRFSPFGGYFLTVINSGDPCIPATGIKDFNADLNAAFTVYPNPNNGVFDIKLNAGKRANGQIAVIDITGRTVFNQPLDVIGLYNTTVDLSQFAKGIYTVQLRTTEGFAAKTISVE